jgi:hypothetical protein
MTSTRGAARRPRWNHRSTHSTPQAASAQRAYLTNLMFLVDESAAMKPNS